MDDPRSLIPIFIDRTDGGLSHLGSGVLVLLSAQYFIFTAAHVSDERNLGCLTVPGRDHLVPIEGTLYHVPLAEDSRKSDRIDVSYLHLTPGFEAKLNEQFKPLLWEEFGIFETLCEGDLYTFAGFPSSRSKVRWGMTRSEMFKFTGGAASDLVYSQLGYDPALHIAMMFDRRRAVVGGNVQIAPHPSGMSGGAIFSWPKAKRASSSPEIDFRLVGIGHSYHEDSGCMVGTRINLYLTAIRRSHPELARALAIESEDMSRIVGVAWYRKDEWERLKLEFEDSEHLPATWDEWREAAQGTIEELCRRGLFAVPVELRAQDISDYCSKLERPNVSRLRAELVNLRIVETIGSINR